MGFGMLCLLPRSSRTTCRPQRSRRHEPNLWLARLEVKEWLLEAKLHIDLDGLGAAIIGRPPFLVVTAERPALEARAEALGYVKPHQAMRGHVEGQGYGKIEFECPAWGVDGT